MDYTLQNVNTECLFSKWATRVASDVASWIVALTRKDLRHKEAQQ